MRTVLATQFTITQCQDRYYTKTAFADILRRYAEAFGKLTLCVPFRRAERPDEIWAELGHRR